MPQSKPIKKAQKKPAGATKSGEGANTADDASEAKEDTKTGSGSLPSEHSLVVVNSFRDYPAGTIVSKDDPVVKGREHLFRPASDVIRER